MSYGPGGRGPISTSWDVVLRFRRPRRRRTVAAAPRPHNAERVHVARVAGKRMIAEHVMADPLGEADPTPKEQRAIDKLADRVIEQMLRDGSLSTD